MLTEAMLRRLWPHVDEAKPGLIAATVAASDEVFTKYGLNAPLVVAHFMAQISHEFAADNPARAIEFEENLNYSAQRMTQVWPSRFPSVAAALPYAHNPKKLANTVYGARMGNRPGTDDGWDFRGRGASQVTGREGYAKLGAKMGLDLLNQPDLVNEPRYFLECAVADMVICGCLPYAQRDDIRGVTRRLNGGYTNLADRARWLDKWKAALAAAHPDLDHTAPSARPNDGTLRYGDTGFEVKALQERLAELGYTPGKVDSDFGPSTRAALLAFQADNDLPTLGIVDNATRDALQSAPPKPVSEERATATAADLRDAGSTTISNADMMGYVGKGAVTLGGAEAAHKAGWLDQARDYVADFGGIHAVMDAVKNGLHFINDNLWLLVPVAGVVVILLARRVIAARLAEHRSGANMAR